MKLQTFLALLAVGTATAADFPHTFTKAGNEYKFALQPNSAVYFGFQHSLDLGSLLWTTEKMAFGTPGPTFGYTPGEGEMQGFFRIEGISIFAPADSDFDGMDDLWELEHPLYLDPLNSADAAALSPNPLYSGLTNLQEYRLRFGLGNQNPQYYSREISLFNMGAARTEAVSREFSLFNFGAQWSSVEAVSREVTLFNGEAPPIEGYPQLYSREVSLYNFGDNLFKAEALSREVTLFNGEAPPIEGYPQIYSREVSLFNEGAAFYSVEVISREVSLFNDIPQ